MGQLSAPGANAVRLVVFTLFIVALGLMERCQAQPDTYEFEEEVYQVVEGTDLTAVVYVTRTGPHDTPDSSVVVQTSDGTAVAGIDYIATTTTVDFQTSSNRVAVSVGILDNDEADDEPQHTNCFTLSLMSPDPSDGVLGGDTQVCIIDDDNFYGGTCPPPEAVIEANGEAVIEASVDSDSGTVAISWTAPTLDDPSANMVYRCRPIGMSPGFECENGQAFPITYTFTEYNRRIEVDYEAIQFGPVLHNDCKFYLRVLARSLQGHTDRNGTFAITVNLPGYNRRIKVEYSAYTQVFPSMIGDNCVFYLRVLDLIPPEITCPLDMMFPAGEGSANGAAGWTEPVATDNSGKIIMNLFSPPLILVIGIHEFTYIAEDSSGNTASCSFSVTITDDEAPVLGDCPDLTFSTSPGLPTTYVTYSLPNATDNSGMVMNVNCFGLNHDGEVLGIGVYTVVCFAEDPAENTASCQFTITVEDNESPNITCPDNRTVTTDMGQNYDTFPLPPESFIKDNSGLPVTITIEVDGAMHSVGDSVQLNLADSPHLLHYTATDNSSNVVICDMYVTVIDDEHPVLVDCRNLTFSTSPGLPSAYVTYSIPNATDNSGDVMHVNCFYVDHDGQVLGIGMHMVDCVAEDRAGLADFCRFFIIVEDQENPNITCPSDVMNGTEAGSATGVAFWELATVTDNSMVPITPVANEISGSSFDIGTHTVLFSAMDESGNSASCTFTVTIEDNESPNITCPDNRTVTTNAGQNYDTFTLPPESLSEDNSELPVTITIEVDGSTYSIGDSVQLDLGGSPHLLQYTATDNFLNVATCDMYVTVIDDEAPVLVDCHNLTFSTPPDLTFAHVTYSLPSATDNWEVMTVNCFGVDYGGDVLGIGVHMVDCVAEDRAGLTDSCRFFITVEAGGALSTEAIVAIAVCVTAALILIPLAIVCMCLKMRRRARKRSSQHHESQPAPTLNHNGLGHDDESQSGDLYELPDRTEVDYYQSLRSTDSDGYLSPRVLNP